MSELIEDAGPDSERERIDLVVRLGRAMHAYGTASHRVEAALTRLSAHLGLSGQFFATPTAIFASFGNGERTVLVRIEPGSTDLEKVSELEDLLLDLLQGRIQGRAALVALERITAKPARYGPLLTTLAFGLAAGAAARFFGGGWREIATALGLGLVTGLIALTLEGRPNASRLFEPFCAFLATALASAVAAASMAWGGGPIAAYVAALAGMIVLVPGLTLTVAMSELGARHLVSGSARMAGAIVTFLLIGFGVALGQRVASALFGPISATTPVPLPPWTEVPALAVTALGLTVLFRARPRDYPWVLAGAALALYGSRLGAATLGSEFAAFVGAFVLGVVANLLRRVLNRPTALVQVPGLMLLVPGSLGFRSVSSLLSQDVLAGVQAAFTTTLVAVSLVTGLLIANVLVAPRRIL